MRSYNRVMSKTTISVAMATYNGEQFLQQQLESLARQTLLPSELVVCDDASTDGTVEILRRFATSAPFPVRIYQNETRLGPGFNFLNALGRCDGDLVAFCDQDDIWKESKLSVCAEVMSDPNIALVSHSATVFSSKPSAGHWRRPDHRSQVWSSCEDFAGYRWQLLGFSIVMRRAVLNSARVPAYNAALSELCAHDIWATAAALSYGQVVLLPDELAFYRLHEKNTTLRPRANGLTRAQPDPAACERAVEQYAGLAKFLRYAASFCDEQARQTFHDYVGQAERTSHLCSERARLHHAYGRRLAATKQLAGMLARGNYRSRGLGAKAFVRDALLTVFT
jgi:glycosyltransferase involved in cell wall biosynthesis